MRTWNLLKAGKIGIGTAVTAAVISSGASVEAAGGFLAEVPAGDWSYSAVNELIAAKVVPDYAVMIPEGRVLSRLEMAMIVDNAMQNQAQMTAAQQETVNRLNSEYYYDMKKLTLLNRLDKLDSAQMDKLNGGQGGESLSAEEKASLKKAAALADKLSIHGYARIRNDHFLKDKDGGGTERTTRANMIHVQVDTAYKVNDNWAAHADIGYRNSFSGFDETKSLSPGENQTGLTMDGYVTGKFPKLGLDAKIGKWNEWNIYGWGMDIDCDFSGIQLTYGKNKFKTFFTTGQMDLWDNNMTYRDAAGNTVYGSRDKEQVTSLRFFYPFDDKNDINFGVSYSSAMATRYQDPDQGRVFYYYTHAHHKFDNNWSVRAGIINSNARRNNTPEAGTKTKSPGRWLQIDYKGAKLDKPNTYGITLDYRYEPALTWPTVTDWCGRNEKFVRLGFSYVPYKNILLDTFYTWAKEIDTGARNDLYRFQAQFFF